MKFFTAVTRSVTAGLLMALAGTAVAQQAYPNKPIRIIIPTGPGNANSLLARMISQNLTERLGQPVVLENRPGANMIIGTTAVARAAPDGYTFLLASSTLAALPSLLSSLPYDPIKDFDPIAAISKSQHVLLINPSVPANNVQELIAFAKSKPGQLNFASSGVGTAPHLAGELFNIMTGTKIQHVPYTGAVYADLIGGQVQMSFQNPIGAIPQIKSGKLKGLAITGDTRLETLPQVPTFAEAGLPGFEMRGWYGLIAPAGTPKEIIGKMSSEMTAILLMPDLKEKLLVQGMEPFVLTPDQFAAMIKADMARLAKIIKTANIKI